MPELNGSRTCSPISASSDHQTVNDTAMAPFGGMGASGNGGRFGGPANRDEFSQWRWITVQDKATPFPF